MDWMGMVSSVFIGFGAALMFLNIILHRKNIRAIGSSSGEQRRRFKTLVAVHLLFMCFFFLGYLGVLYLFLNRIDFASTFFVSIIFFFGAVFVCMGIIIQKRMHAALQHKNEELLVYAANLESERGRLTELNQQLRTEIADREKAQEADRMKSDFLSLVSHELRTPLTSIFGFTKLIEKKVCTLDATDNGELADSKQRMKDNLYIISDECCRLTRLINNVLDLSKLEAGKVDWDDQPMRLDELIQSGLRAVRGLLVENEHIELRIDLPTPAPVIMVDSDLFTQVFINLVSNAFKFTQSGIIQISASHSSEGLSISVSDEGEGIAPDNLSSIFDKFYIVRTGDTLGGNKQGTGLGLPICKGIIDHYGGKIWAESEVGKGSTFHILLPDTLLVES